MARPRGHLGSWNTVIEPRGHRRVTEIVWPLGQRRRTHLRRERDLARPVPQPRIGDRRDDTSMFAGEHPVLSVRAEPLQVIPEQLNELGRTRYRAALLGVSPLDDSCFSVARRADLGTSGGRDHRGSITSIGQVGPAAAASRRSVVTRIASSASARATYMASQPRTVSRSSHARSISSRCP